MDPLKKLLIYQECMDFLNYEADLLDNHQYNQWSDLLTNDIVYKVPVRVTREMHADTEFSARAYHMDENRGSLNMRIKRTNTEYNWAEDPISRTRHFLTNFRMELLNDQGEEVQMKTNLLLHRSKFDVITPDVLSAERTDTLRKVDGKWKLAKRIVHLDHTTIPMSNLAIYF